MQDLNYAARWLIRNRLFSLACILTLALAIGGNTAIFSVVNAVLFPAPSFHSSDQLVRIVEEKKQITISDYEELWRNLDFLQSAAGYKVKLWHFSGYGEPARIPGYSVSASFLTTLSVQPAIGRNFTAQEDHTGSPFVALISDEMWKGVFHADPQILGRVVRFDDVPCEIIGVMPPDFRFPDSPIRQPQFWSPLGYETVHPLPGGRRVFTIGRLKPGITMLEAQERLNRIAENFKSRNYKLTISPLDQLSSGYRRFTVSVLFIVTVSVLLVLFIASANIVNYRDTPRVYVHPAEQIKFQWFYAKIGLLNKHR